MCCWLLGAWIAGSLFMIMVATQNFGSVDRLLAAPSSAAAAQIQTMGREKARAFLRYQVSEQNRWYFETWEKIQLALGVALLAATLRQSKLLAILVAAMFILVNLTLSQLARRLEVRQRRRYGAGRIVVTGGPEDLVLVDAEAEARLK